jgi:pSer/pThr/pTyr-binding forkhead associated (FHA) protein
MYRAWDLPANDEAGDGAELLVPATQPVGPSQSQPTPTPQEEEPLARLVSMDSQVASINCTLDTMLLGRKNTCTVVLDDPTVSATHCRIYYDDNVPMGSLRPELVLQHAEQQQAAKQAAAWPPARSINTNGEVFFGASHFWIEDLSSNGTFVNMVKLGRNCRARLCHNDVISLCKPEQKRKTKGTKMTWQFKLNCPQKLEKVKHLLAKIVCFDEEHRISKSILKRFEIATRSKTRWEWARLAK